MKTITPKITSLFDYRALSRPRAPSPASAQHYIQVVVVEVVIAKVPFSGLFGSRK